MDQDTSSSSENPIVGLEECRFARVPRHHPERVNGAPSTGRPVFRPALIETEVAQRMGTCSVSALTCVSMGTAHLDQVRGRASRREAAG